MKTLVHVSSDYAYSNLEQLVAHKVSALKGPLFKTNAISLFEMYLNGIPVTHRQHYNCNCCRRFIETYGGLVTIDKLGQAKSVLWDEDCPNFFRKSIKTMQEAVEGTRVCGIFVNDKEVWGTLQTKEWTHLSGTSKILVHDSKLLTAEQVEADLLERHGILCRSMADFSIVHAQQAVRVLEADALDRSEKTLGAARWFLELLTNRDASKHQAHRQNIIWLAVAAAPAGWCNIRSSMIGTLLQDIKDGLDFETISARWGKKMHPLQYRRAQAAPTDNQIEAANKLVEKLGVGPSLPRRFAKLEDCKTFWQPGQVIPMAEPVGGVFDHLKSKPTTISAIELPVKKLTWDKFYREELAQAAKIEFKTKAGGYYGLVTQINATAPPILQWDFEGGDRNPVSWYFIHGGSHPVQWNLPSGIWVQVNALMWRPCHWYRRELMEHHGEAVYMVLEGCRPASRLGEHRGGNFFMEDLRPELNGIRSVLEAYAKNGVIVGAEESTACGFALQKRDEFNVHLRMTNSSGEKREFLLDRWE